MISSQMLKGILDGSILAIISKEETYGYEISQKLKTFGFSNISEGTIYPLLLRLEKSENINAIYRASEVGPKRKYYTITEKGKEELKYFFYSFNELENAINKIEAYALKDGEQNES